MQLYNALDDMFADAGKSPHTASHELFNSNTIQVSKSRGSLLSVAKVAKIAEYCGYELCLVPEQSVPRNAIAISPDQSKPSLDDGVRLGKASKPKDSEEVLIG